MSSRVVFADRISALFAKPQISRAIEVNQMWDIVDDDLINSDSAIGGNSKIADLRCSIFVKPDNIVRGVVGQAVRLATRSAHRCFHETGGSSVIKANFVRIALGKPEVAVCVANEADRR